MSRYKYIVEDTQVVNGIRYTLTRVEVGGRIEHYFVELTMAGWAMARSKNYKCKHNADKAMAEWINNVKSANRDIINEMLY